jgi:hypothetical protein
MAGISLLCTISWEDKVYWLSQLALSLHFGQPAELPTFQRQAQMPAQPEMEELHQQALAP